MNIFYLDRDPKKAARYHCDSHVNKMITETVQMLCTNYRLRHGTPGWMYVFKSKQKTWVWERRKYMLYAEHRYSRPIMFLDCHHNHPCTQWMRNSRANWEWSVELLKELYNEFKRRYNKNTHKSFEVFKNNEEKLTPKTLPLVTDASFHEAPALAMPEEYMQPDEVESYRDFYFHTKFKFSKWNFGKEQAPDWWLERLERNPVDNWWL